MTEKEVLDQIQRCKEQLKLFTTALNTLTESVNHLVEQMETAEKEIKRIANERENRGNIHRDCEYYNEKTDTCYNYLMVTGLAFEVSRHKKCITNILNGKCEDARR